MLWKTWMHFLANPVLDKCNLLGRHFPVPPKHACYSCSVMSHSGKQREEARKMGIFFFNGQRSNVSGRNSRDQNYVCPGVPFDVNDSHSSSFQCWRVSMRGRSSLPENYRRRKWALHPGNWVRSKDHQPCSRIGLHFTLWLDCVFTFSLILLLSCCLARRFYALKQTMKRFSFQ